MNTIDTDHPLDSAPGVDAPLDHDEIEASNLIERYHRGALSAVEEARFEAHFVDCEDCQHELHLQASFERGLRQMAAEEAARALIQVSVWQRLARSRPFLGALAVFALTIALFTSWDANRRLRQQLETPASSDLLRAPLARTSTTLLSAVRGDEDTPEIVDDGTPWSLAVDVGLDPGVAFYSARIEDAQGEVHFEATGLQPNVLEVLLLTFPSGFLPAGDYQLTVTSQGRDGPDEAPARYPFRLRQ